ncbi:MAG: ABC transporter ATP-binding protein [Candidatus Polarisedimenticolia bacterium]
MIAAGPSPALSARGLTFTYRQGAHPALSEVDLDLAPGEWGLLLGPTGAGKSTLARILNRTIPRFFPGRLEGTIEVAGRDTRGLTVPAMAQLVGVVFQDFETQIVSTTCLLEVAFAMESRCLPPAETQRRALALLARVGLEGFAGRDPATLSGGEKQRLVIAAVLALEAPLLVLDEPASDLDPAGREAMYALVSRLEGTTLLVDHDLEALPVTQRGVLLEGGRVMEAWQGPANLPRRAARLESSGVRPAPIPRLIADLETRWSDRVPGDLPPDPDAFSRRLRGLGWSLSGSTPVRPSPPLEEILVCDRVSHVFGEGPSAVRALDDVSLAVRRAERLVIIGANGSGKTTLARHLNGLIAPTGGRVMWMGRDVRSLTARQRAREIGFVFQNPDHQIFAPTLLEEAVFGPLQQGVAPALAREQAGRALAAVGLEALEEADPFTLTKGERQRLAVASALACEPSLIVLDEPTTGLDLRQQRDLMALLDRLQEQGHALVIITHALWLVDDRTHRVALMSRGRLVAVGPPGEVLLDQETMHEAGLRLPDLARLSRAWGAPLMTADRWAASLKPPGAGSGG